MSRLVGPLAQELEDALDDLLGPDWYEHAMRSAGETVTRRVIEDDDDRAVEIQCRELAPVLGSGEWMLAAAEILFPEFAAEHPEIIPPL